MKKTALSLALILMVFSVFAQKKIQPPEAPDMPIDTATKLITYTDVVQMGGVTQAELFKRAKKWFYSFYKSPSTVVRTMDSTNYVIEGRHSINMIKTIVDKKDTTKLPSGLMNYTITINFKDGKYRYKITAFNLKDLSYHPAEKLLNENDPGVAWNYQMLEQTDAFITNLIAKLKGAMIIPSNQQKDDNW